MTRLLEAILGSETKLDWLNHLPNPISSNSGHCREHALPLSKDLHRLRYSGFPDANSSMYRASSMTTKVFSPTAKYLAAFVSIRQSTVLDRSLAAVLTGVRDSDA